MKLIVGLGNIGKEYERTRHNAGFMTIDKVADKLGVTFNQTKFKATIATLKKDGETVILMKPSTYMNLSGEAVIEAVHFYKIDPQDILIIHDDLDLPVGKIRLRTKGSSGGQNGMKNIIQHLGTQDIKRIRVGIDKDPRIPVVDYVLGKISKEDMEAFDDAANRAADACVAFINTPFERVMNKFNQK